MNQKEALESIRQIALEYALSSDDKVEPSEILSGSGNAWFYDPVNKTMEVVKRGDKIVRNEAYIDHKNRILSYVSGKVVLIPSNEIIQIGYN
tara:strand:+ start:670 stop:945 length:276 start_codon:yes stop_codon:yes gene_type:complete